MSEQSASKGKTIGILVAAIVAVAAVAGIGYSQFSGSSDTPAASGSGDIQATIQDGTQTASASGTEELAEGDQIVATVDGESIKTSDVLRFMQSQNINMAQQNFEDVYPLALEQVIRGQIVINQSRGANLENDPEILKQLEGAKKHIINTVFLQREVDTQITADVLQKAYNDHISKIPDVEERRARHILLDSEDKAKEVITKLNDGADFAQTAKENSVGPTGPNGGDLGYFTKDQMVPSFAEAAFSMSSGDVSSEPVKSEFGYHVIKIEDARTKPKPSFEEMENFLMVQMRQDILNDLIDGWQKDAKIEKFELETSQPEPAAGEEVPAAEESN
ncbi:MAG: peptidylprolyl isomerase [Pseudomonadota bacterium]